MQEWWQKQERFWGRAGGSSVKNMAIGKQELRTALPDTIRYLA